MHDELNDEQKAEMFLGIHDGTLPGWDESVATQLAKSEGLVLTDAHFEVLHYLRRCHERFGHIRHARTLTLALETRFATQGGRRFLYMLFPGGPVTQGCAIAGIPTPKDCINPSFGTAA